MAKYITLTNLEKFLETLDSQVKTGRYVADTDNYGCIKVPAQRTTTPTLSTGGTTAGRYYGVELDANGKAFVNVPWENTDTHLTIADGAPFSISGGKLDIKVDLATMGVNPDGLYATDAYVGTNVSLNNCVRGGVYQIGTTIADQSPIVSGFPVMSPSTLAGRLWNIATTGEGGEVLSQFLMLNNNTGGEGGIYVRSIQNNKIKPWGRLQTNVEVGIVTSTALDNDPFLDNGIFSGVCSDTGETFVLICINNYAAAPQNQSISQLKYSLGIGSQDGITAGTVKIEKRSRNTTGFWNDWEEIGGGGLVDIPAASNDNIGGIKLGYSQSGKKFPIKLDTNKKAYAEIGTATDSAFGVIKVAATRPNFPTISTGGTTAGRYYGVELDGNGNAFVNVPWTNSSTNASDVAYAIQTVSSTTISSLSKETVTKLSSSLTSTLTISGFASKNTNKVTTYGLQFTVGSGQPALVVPESVKWANGIEPILTEGSIIDIIFSTLDGATYTATWTKYF